MNEHVDKFRIVRRVGKRDYPLARLYAMLSTAQQNCDRLNQDAFQTGKGRPYRVQGGSRR